MTYRYIYKITCTSGTFKNKFYFGQHTTDNLNDNYKGSGVKIRDYYKKYPNDYIKEIIAFYNTQEELNKAEYDIILPYLNNEMCINLKEGGGNNKLSEETKQKISESHIGLKYPNRKSPKGKHMSEETKLKIRKSLLGHKVKEETKKKMSENKKDKYIGENNPMYNRHHSEITKEKMSENKKDKYIGENNPMYNRHHSEESKNKISASNKGKYRTEETRQKISEIVKGRTPYCKGKRRIYDNPERTKYHYE